MNNLAHIKGILFDLDGVLYVGSKRIDDLIEAINRVRNSPWYSDRLEVLATNH